MPLWASPYRARWREQRQRETRSARPNRAHFALLPEACVSWRGRRSRYYQQRLRLLGLRIFETGRCGSQTDNQVLLQDRFAFSSKNNIVAAIQKQALVCLIRFSGLHGSVIFQWKIERLVGGRDRRRGDRRGRFRLNNRWML